MAPPAAAAASGPDPELERMATWVASVTPQGMEQRSMEYYVSHATDISGVAADFWDCACET